MKRKAWDITVKDNPNRVVMGENDEFYTTDTEAYLVFKLDDKNFNPESAVLTLENRNDGSLKNETVDVVDGLIEWEMPQRYIEHFGNWQGQLVYEDTKDGQPELYTSAPFTFVVNAHIGDKKKPSLVEIENWEKFIRDGTELIETWEDMEDLRQANEAQRQDNYQELLDTGVLQTNINTKLEQLEEEYAPKLTEVTAQLAQKPSYDETRLKAVKLELEDMSETTLGAMTSDATFTLLSVPQDDSVTSAKVSPDFFPEISNIQAKVSEVNIENTLNLIDGVNEGVYNFYKFNTTQVTYEDGIDFFLGIDKILNFTHDANTTNGIGLINAIDYTVGDIIKFGAWFRSSDLIALGTKTFYVGAHFVNNGVLTSTPVTTNFLTGSQLTTEGFVDTKTTSLVTLRLSVEKEHDGWVFIKVELTSTNSSYTGFRPIIVTRSSTESGSIDLANFTCLKNGELQPFGVYPDVITGKPMSAIQLTKKVNSLENPVNTGDWVNKTFVSLGDSITWQDGNVYASSGLIARGYQTILKEKLGFASYLNKGVSARPMANGTANGDGTNATGKTVDYSTYDLVVIAAGTNDFKLNVPLGEKGIIGDTIFDTNTFYGAYRDLLEYILTNKSNIRIVLFTPLQRDNGGYDVNFTNTAGNKLIDYVNAIHDIGEMYSIPVCDMYRNSGFTKLTLDTYTRDGLHPNDAGYQRMGNYAVGFIKDIGS